VKQSRILRIERINADRRFAQIRDDPLDPQDP
jgi:hypothetical protein